MSKDGGRTEFPTISNSVGRKPRVVYQSIVRHGAVGIIERGFMSGYREAGADLCEWNCDANNPPLEQLLTEFRPTHFCCSLQTPKRENAAWMKGQLLSLLRSCKQRNGLRVVANSFPGNLCEYLGDWIATTGKHEDAGVASFYNQPSRPNAAEQDLLRSGFVDLLTSRFCRAAVPECFRGFLETGVPILVQPHAAESRYIDNRPIAEPDIDILYVGNNWTFKWENMREFVLPMKRHFGDRFVIRGIGWPDGLSSGPLDDNHLSAMASRARVSIAFHEPSQVLKDRPISSNERVFKLLAMRRYVISDPCAVLPYYFKIGRHLDVAQNGEEMVRFTERALEDPQRSAVIAAAGYEHVIGNHSYKKRAERVFELLAKGLRPGVHDFV